MLFGREIHNYPIPEQDRRVFGKKVVRQIAPFPIRVLQMVKTRTERAAKGERTTFGVDSRVLRIRGRNTRIPADDDYREPGKRSAL